MDQITRTLEIQTLNEEELASNSNCSSPQNEQEEDDLPSKEQEGDDLYPSHSSRSSSPSSSFEDREELEENPEKAKHELKAPPPPTKRTDMLSILNDRRRGPHRKDREVKKWSKEEDDLLFRAVQEHGGRNWKTVANLVPGRDHTQCLQRWSKCLQPGLKKGTWTTEEDEGLIRCVQLQISLTQYASVVPPDASNSAKRITWTDVCQAIPGRTAKQCRERWVNNLDPVIQKGPWGAAEDYRMVELYKKFGPSWAAISKEIVGRTENAVKIRWKTVMKSLAGQEAMANSPCVPPDSLLQNRLSETDARPSKVQKRTSAVAKLESDFSSPYFAQPQHAQHLPYVQQQQQQAFNHMMAFQAHQFMQHQENQRQVFAQAQAAEAAASTTGSSSDRSYRSLYDGSVTSSQPGFRQLPGVISTSGAAAAQEPRRQRDADEMSQNSAASGYMANFDSTQLAKATSGGSELSLCSMLTPSLSSSLGPEHFQESLRSPSLASSFGGGLGGLSDFSVNSMPYPSPPAQYSPYMFMNQPPPPIPQLSQVGQQPLFFPLAAVPAAYALQQKPQQQHLMFDKAKAGGRVAPATTQLFSTFPHSKE